MTTPALAVRGLRKSYGQVDALSGVDLVVEEGELLALLGTNGAGKTTLASIVMGLVRADAGRALVFGHDVTRGDASGKTVTGYVPQRTGVYATLTVRRNVEFFGQVLGLRSRELSVAVEEVLGALHLDHLADRRAGQLSTGERRRVHTAIGLVGRPRLLLLDEPTIGADVESRRHLIDLVKARAERGTAVVYTTHYLPEVEQLGANIAVLHRGRIIAGGSCDELVRKYGRTELRLSFEGPAPVVATVGGEHATATGSVLTIATDTPWIALTHVMRALVADLERVQSLEIVRAELESVFLELTRRHDATGALEEAPRAIDEPHVLAS